MELEDFNRKAIIYKRKTLTLQERLGILKRLDAGEQATKLAEEFQVARSTISNIKRSKSKIIQRKNNVEACGGSLEKKRFKGTKNAAEKATFDWLTQQRDLGIPISGPILKRKALHFNQTLGGPIDFKASVGWLTSFKKRYGLRCVTVEGEKLNVNVPASEEFRKKLTEFIQTTGISSDFIYNCDESGHYWKGLPNKERSDKKDRVTVMTCVNASGTHKIPLLIIGKYEKPVCFKNVKTLPVIYRHQCNAWMDKLVMIDWYKNIFIPEVKRKYDIDNNKNIRIVLIMDNAPCHILVGEFNVLYDFCTVMLLPPNVTTLIQPMDQGIIKNFKIYYKELFLKRLNSCIVLEGPENVDKALNSFTILDCCIYSAIAWDQVSETTIKNCWKKLIFPDEPISVVGSADISNIHTLLSRIPGLQEISFSNVNAWLSIENNLPGWQPRSDYEIASGIFSDMNKENFVDDEQKPEENSLNVSTDDALEGLTVLMHWFGTYDNISIDVNFRMLEQCRQLLFMCKNK